jgi:hypothetical protein
MFVTFIRAENTKALINQMQLVASGVQRKTCLGMKLHTVMWHNNLFNQHVVEFLHPEWKNRLLQQSHAAGFKELLSE